MRVYVVDDSAIIRDRLKRMLADEPDIDTIGETGDAHRAIDAIRDQRPDVVLLDIQLLNGNGIDVLERAKQAQPPPAVIVLTDYPYPEYRDKCLQAGADYFFIKSIEFDRVIPALKELVAKGQEADRSGQREQTPPGLDSFSIVKSPITPILSDRAFDPWRQLWKL